jgi:glucosamine--fructose-6-phosphate aminotransferase (isomerizing)
MALRTREKCRKVAVELMNKKDLFVLGKGYAEPIAFEGALKIKEMCYLHAEGFSGTSLERKRRRRRGTVESCVRYC